MSFNSPQRPFAMSGRILWGVSFDPRAVFLVKSTAFTSCFPVRTRLRTDVQKAAHEYWSELEEIARRAMQRNVVRLDPRSALKYQQVFEIDRNAFEVIAAELGYDGTRDYIE